MRTRGSGPSVKSLGSNKQPRTYFFCTLYLGVHPSKKLVQLRECILIYLHIYFGTLEISVVELNIFSLDLVPKPLKDVEG